MCVWWCGVCVCLIFMCGWCVCVWWCGVRLVVWCVSGGVVCVSGGVVCVCLIFMCGWCVCVVSVFFPRDFFGQSFQMC